MPGINLYEVRGISDSITTAFHFVKQEFVPLIRVFAILVLPLVFVDLFFKSFSIRETFGAISDPVAVDSSYNYVMHQFMIVITSVIVYLWVQLVFVSYLRVYHDKYRDGDSQRITVREVWRALARCAGRGILWSFLFILIILVGLLFFILPGIYLSVALFFTIYLIVLRDKPIGKSISGAIGMVKGKWWDVLFYVFLLQLIVGMLAYVFTIPYMAVVFMSVFSGGVPGGYELTFTMLLSSLGQYLMQIIMVMGMGIRFFSLLEEKEHIVLLGKIGHMGNTDAQKADGEKVY